MLRVLGNRKRLCNGVTRRDLLHAGGLAFGGMGLSGLMASQAAANVSATSRALCPQRAAGSFDSMLENQASSAGPMAGLRLEAVGGTWVLTATISSPVALHMNGVLPVRQRYATTASEYRSERTSRTRPSACSGLM